MDKKTEIVNFRTTWRFKSLLKVAAAEDGRSMANFIENLVSQHCKNKGLQANVPTRKNSKKETA